MTCDTCHLAEIHDEHRMLGIEYPADIPEVGEVRGLIDSVIRRSNANIPFWLATDLL
jgi:hypothetical protein